MEEKRFAAGDTLFSEGDASEYAYLLHAGRVEILKTGAHGQIRLAVLGPGDVVGEMGLLEDRARAATARALDDVVADEISRAAFAQMLVSDPKRSMQLLRAMFERLRTMNRMVIEQSNRDPDLPRARVTLVPLTPETQTGLPPDGLEVTRFPFRVGRKPATHEDETFAFNDLALADTTPYFLSLNHFSIDVDHDDVVVRDRGSEHGTRVNGTPIGTTAARDVAPLPPGENEVVAGAVPVLFHRRGSPFRFRVVVE